MRRLPTLRDLQSVRPKVVNTLYWLNQRFHLLLVTLFFFFFSSNHLQEVQAIPVPVAAEEQHMAQVMQPYLQSGQVTSVTGLQLADLTPVIPVAATPTPTVTVQQVVQQQAVQEKALVTTAPPTSGSVPNPGGFRSPVAYQYISQSFNFYTHPGEDLVAPYGTPIYATKSGTIQASETGWNGGYGMMLIEDLGSGYTARYAHLLSVASGIQTGSVVQAGQLLAYIGMTGRTTGPHLHFELRKNSIPFDPGF